MYRRDVRERLSLPREEEAGTGQEYTKADIRHRKEELREWIGYMEPEEWRELLEEIRSAGRKKTQGLNTDIPMDEAGSTVHQKEKNESSASGTWPEAAREEKAEEGKDWLSRFIVETDLNLREGEASADREVLQYKESLLTFLEGEESFAALEELVHIAKRSGNERLRESVNQWLEPEEMYRRDVREKRNPATPAQNFLVRQFLEWKPLIQSVFQKDVEEEDGYAELKLYQRKEEGSVQEVQRTQRYLQEIILDMEKDGQTGENIQPERVFAPLFGNLAVEDTEPVFSYQPASLITARPAHQRYSSAAPSPPVLEEIQSKVASAVKEQTNDIKFVTRPPAFTTASEEYAKEIRQIRTSQERQHKEIEEIKQIQRSLLERTETGRMTETVMRQMQKQLKIEKLRRGM